MPDLGTLNEGSSALYIGTLRSETGEPIDMTALDSLTLTEYDPADGAILNSRDAQDAKNAHDVAVYATLQTIVIDGVTKTYNLAWQMTPADNVIRHGEQRERRAAMFVGTWAGGTKRCSHELTWLVRNLTKMP